MHPLAALAVAGALASPSADTKPSPINPGYWDVSFHYLGLINKRERWCIRPKDIARFLGGPCNHIYHCSYPYQTIGDGKLAFKGEIRGRDELYHCAGGGDYTATTVSMHVSCSGHWHIVPVLGASASTEGSFIADDCPADAKHFK